MIHSKTLRRAGLSVALGMCIAGGVQAQSTTGSIQGSVPVQAGSTTTVLVKNTSGFSRTTTVDASGRYTLSSLPVGTYTVTVNRDGQVIGSREVAVVVGSTADSSFTTNAGTTTLDGVTVVASAPAAIDFSTTDTRMVITAEQLERLPLGRSAEAIALLAPGAVSGASGYSALSGLVSFGGSGVSENAYYINGYFSGEPLSNLGGFTLPYGAIAQQETFTGGYSSKYGRSAGGVINQVGKRGTNEWTFGGQILHTPNWLREDPEDIHYPDLDLPDGYSYTMDSYAGTLYQQGKGRKLSNATYSAYVGGPIVQDKLFFFLAGEHSKSEGVSIPTRLGTQRSTHSDTTSPKIYAKIDWNITDNHLLEGTWMWQETDATGFYRAYDAATGTHGNRLAAVPDPDKKESDFKILKYTGFLTDNLTASVTYGRSEFDAYSINPNFPPGVPYIASAANQNPAYTGGTPIPNTLGGYQGRDGHNETDGLRADLEWVVGNHTLSVGLDNITFKAENEGTAQLADYWSYHRGNPTSNINAALGVGAPGGQGYYARQLKYFNSTDMSLDQKAWYLEDRWQISDNFLLSLGIRNDEFTNKNDSGAVYMSSKDQWAPRLGFSWDVLGDATLKVFGNAGRYFLAMPNNVAIRGASASTYTSEYFTYSGISPNGTPTGLTPVPGVGGAAAPGAVSSNGEYGTPVDVLSFSPNDLKNMYQDEYILGFEKMLGENWNVGAKLTYRDLKSSVDDICDPYTMMDVNGISDYFLKEGKYIGRMGNQHVEVAYCYMFNPGGTNTFSLAHTDAAGNYTGGRTELKMSSEDWGLTDPLKRTYKAIDLFVERPYDGTWGARLSYTYSKSEGNNEGQVKSEFGQTNISKTQDWDAWQIMQYANGYLANDRRHQIKLYGSYALTDELVVAANLRAQSGTPISCLGYYNPDGSIDEGSDAGDPIGYGASYHTCFGKIAKPGDKRTSWTHLLDLSLGYRPAVFDGKVNLSLEIFNVFNQQRATQVNVTSEDSPYTVSNTYLMPIGRTSPRSMRVGMSYDF